MHHTPQATALKRMFGPKHLTFTLNYERKAGKFPKKSPRGENFLPGRQETVAADSSPGARPWVGQGAGGGSKWACRPSAQEPETVALPGDGEGMVAETRIIS